jgi:hypothetical protein
MVWIPLTLGEFMFDEATMEVPETMGDLGGTQSVSTHDFPGGIRTQKSFGYFPSDQILWRGHFHGFDAVERKEAVKRLLVAGTEIQLTYGSKAWLGRITKFVATVRNVWLYDYELHFTPRLDLSAGFPIVPYPGAGTIMALHLLALESLIQNGLDPAFIGEAAAIGIGGPASLVLLQVQGMLYASGGSISALSNGDKQVIFQSTLGALAAIHPYRLSNDAVLSSPAAEASARIKAIQDLMVLASPPRTVIHTVNPNLTVLAAQHYGDASQWRKIANANGLADPQPTGSYNLVIPP